jgi:predicted DNA-binding transcriptional regulator YafY
VTFDYRKSGSASVDPRDVEPWGVVSMRGAWYLVGFDRQRQDRRVFRLSRIQGIPRTHGARDAYDVPTEVDPRALVGDWLHGNAAEKARVRVATGRAHDVRLIGQIVTASDSVDGSDLVEIDLQDARAVASLIASYGDAVTVLEPQWLRDEVGDLLRGALLAHGGAT